jgi:hypothetical protein
MRKRLLGGLHRRWGGSTLIPWRLTTKRVYVALGNWGIIRGTDVFCGLLFIFVTRDKWKYECFGASVLPKGVKFCYSEWDKGGRRGAKAKQPSERNTRIPHPRGDTASGRLTYLPCVTCYLNLPIFLMPRNYCRRELTLWTLSLILFNPNKSYLKGFTGSIML